MNRLEQRLFFSTGLVLALGSAAYIALGGLSTPTFVTDGQSIAPPLAHSPTGNPATLVRPPIEGPSVPATTNPPDEPGVLSSPGMGIPNGLREPTGEDRQNPKVVRELLRAQLAEASPRWDYVAELLAVYREPLEADVKAALLAALRHGNAAGAVQAYGSLHDGTVVPDLLKLLDDPNVDLHDRGTVLVTLSSIPGADPSEVVTGIESRLTGNADHDRALLAAIARTGGVEAARALIDAISRAKNPREFGADVWRELDLTKSPDAADRIASTLRLTTLSPEALGVLVEMAGRPGASRALVESLLALDAETTPEPVRRRVIASLGATADDAAIDRLIAIAAKGGDYASVAAKSVGDVTSASPAVRAKLLDLARDTTDENLRTQTVHALGALRAAIAVPLLTGYLASASPLLRAEAAIALGRIGKESAPAVDALAKAYDTGDEAMRQHAVIALGKIGDERSAALLKQFLVIEKSEKVKTTLNGALRALEPR